MKHGTTLGILSFFIGVVGLMITDSKLWLYGGFGLLVILTVAQMIIDSVERNRES